MKKVILFLGILLSANPAGHSQSPSFFGYQAVARNSDGSVLGGSTIGIMISILEGSDKGTVLYSEKHVVETNEFGLFTVTVGSGQSNQEFAAINWDSGNPKWIQVRLDAQNTGNFVLMGASQLLSVPYALHAGKAASAPAVLAILTEAERDGMINPADGLMIFNSTTNSINIRKDGDWWEAGLEKIVPVWECGKSITDARDNRSYKTVMIGSRCWMAENLNTGQAVNLSAGQANNSIIEKFCYDNNVLNCDTYGGLYMWDELMNYSNVKGSQGICPEGWHVPTDQEWQEMEMALGMSEADAMRSNVWRGTDQGVKLGPEGSSGYNALYAGRSVPGFGFTALGTYEYVWTSNESGDYAWRRCLSITDPKVGRYDTFPKTYGMSVRCVK